MEIDADIERAELVRLRDLYLDLLIGGITHTIYSKIDLMELPEEFVERVTPSLREADDKWMIFYPDLARAQGRDWPLYAQTMIGLERMRSVRRCVETVLAEDVPGDMIEAGVWRGGVGILMRGILKAYGVEDRQVWVADSFRGLPPPDPQRDRGVETHELEWLAVPLEEVRENFRRYGLLDEQVRFVEGWFRDTLPTLQGVRWSVVRIDSDLYGSTMDALSASTTRPRLARAGVLVVLGRRRKPLEGVVDDQLASGHLAGEREVRGSTRPGSSRIRKPRRWSAACGARG